MAAVESFTSGRLRLRRPVTADVSAIFARYAADPEVTRYLSWPTHTSTADTEAFIAFSDEAWARGPSGPLLIETLDGTLLGGTGLGFDTATRASTGYVLARDVWGRGFATETLHAMVELARSLGLWRLDAICHHTHGASARVLEKGGFEREAVMRRHTVFPNLDDPTPPDVLLFARVVER